MQSVLDLVRERRAQAKWEKATADIFYFIEHYVPKHLFDLKKAAPQQIAMLKSVMTGKRYFVIRAPRKGGKTICVAIIAVWLVLRNQTFRVFILSGSEEQAEWLYDYCSQILQPDNYIVAEFFAQFIKEGANGIGKTKTRFKLGGFIMYTAASSKKVNAPTADCLIMDEFVLIPTNIVEEAWPMIRSSEDPRRFLLSTATAGKENTEAFLEILDDAEAEGWQKFEWFPEDCRWLQTDVALMDSIMARKILSEDMYRTQYEGSLPKRAGRIFARTLIREAFVAPDEDNPGFLKDGTPFELDPHKRVSRGEAKGGIDWGWDHDTVITIGYRGLGGKLVLTRQVVGAGTSASEWADLLCGTDEADSEPGLAFQFEANDWFADAAGAFQNQELKLRGLRVVSRAFQHQSRGKEWMIGIIEKYLRERNLVIPDIEEFALLKQQMRKWRRDVHGKPKKGFDHCNDSLLCFGSGFNPTYYDTTELREVRDFAPTPVASANLWNEFNSQKQTWLPDSWKGNDRLRKEPWEK